MSDRLKGGFIECMMFDKKVGVEAICGSMYAGKTEELIRRLKRLDLLDVHIFYSNQLLIIAIVKMKSYHIVD